jgi:hypothetical protein
LPERNEPGNPIIRHIPDKAVDERIEPAAAQPLDISDSGQATAESVDEEIARLKKRLAELEEAKRTRRT